MMHPWILLIIFSIPLLLLSWIDLKTLHLPDPITLGLLWLGLAINAFHYWISAEAAIIGAIAGYLSFFGISKIYFSLRHQEGLGLGDAKLLAAIGAWLGWQVLPLVVLSASMLNLIMASMLYLWRQSALPLNKQYFPFAPALAISAISVMGMQLLTIK